MNNEKIKFSKEELIPLMENGKMPDRGEYPMLPEALDFLGLKEITLIYTSPKVNGGECSFEITPYELCRDFELDGCGGIRSLESEDDEGELRIKDEARVMEIYNEAVEFALLFQNYEMLLTPYAIQRYAGRVLDADNDWYDIFARVKKGYVIKKLNPQQWDALTRYYTPQKYVSKKWRKFVKTEYVVVEAEKAVVIPAKSFQFKNRYSMERDLVKGNVVFVEDKEDSVKYNYEWSVDCMD